MNFWTDWSLLGQFTIKGIISCIIVAVLGYIVANINAFHEPQDDE